MITENSPKGIDEKLQLEEPELWDVDDFRRHKRMAVARGNTALKAIFENTRTDLPKLIAGIRWSKLRMPYADFAKATGMSPNGYKPMEKDRGPQNLPHRAKYTKLLAHWEKQGISSGIREQLLDLLTCPELLEQDPSCIDLLSAIGHIRSQSGNLLGVQQMNNFYQRVGYECGHKNVARQFGKAYGKKNVYNTVWQRAKTDTVPDYVEVVQLVNVMYAGRGKEMKAKHALRRAQGEAIWSMAKKRKYLECTIEEPLAEFLVLLERDLATDAGITLTAEALRTQYDMGPQNADLLIRCELIGSDAIEPLLGRWMDDATRKRFLRLWNDARGTEKKRNSFGALAGEAMDERGYTAADLATLLRVQAPEERGKKAHKDRSQRYRGDSEVHRVLFDNRVSNQIAVEALTQLLARDADHADELRETYIRERERYLRRTGAWISGEGFTMRIKRELANVDMNELALHFLPRAQHGNRAAVKDKNHELQRLERGEGKEHKISFGEIMPILEKLANERAAAAIARIEELDVMDESLKKFATVQEMASNLIKGKKGAGSVSDAMRNIAQNDSLWLRADLVTKMAEGEFVPALPPLRTMGKATVDTVLPEEVVRDWHVQFPHQLERGAMDIGKFTQPLPRVLCTLLATKEASAIRFFEQRVLGIVPTHGTKMLRDLEEGNPVDWKYIHKILLAMGLQPFQIAYRLAKGLYDSPTGDVETVLAELVPVLQKQKLEIHPVNLPGLTSAELKPYQKNVTKKRR